MNYFGLDIGSGSIKVVQLARFGKEIRVAAYGICPSPPKGLNSEAEVDLELLSTTIKKLVKDSKIATKNTAIALSETDVYTRVIETPPLSEDELSSAVSWEAEQYIPLPLSDVKLDFQILSMPQRGERQAKCEVLLVAAPYKIINKYLKVLKMADLNPVFMETQLISRARALVSPSSPTSLLVEMGANNCELAIVRNGLLSFARSVSSGGNALTRAISLDLGLDFSQAEEYKKNYGMDRNQLDGKIYQAMKPVLGILVEEMKRSLSYFFKEKGESVGRVVLSGGSSQLLGLVSYLAEALGVEVTIGDPWSGVSLGEKERGEIGADGVLFSAALGLALKEL